MAILTTGIGAISLSGTRPYSQEGLQYLYSGTSTSFIVPENVFNLTIECIGGGGGGGFFSTGEDSNGLGGGGGAYAKSYIDVQPGETYTLTVGQGGSGGSTSKTGGTTSFTSGATTYCAAIGGNGGLANSEGTGAYGGKSGFCVYNIIAHSGGNGGHGNNNGSGGGGGAAGENGAGFNGSTGPGPEPAGPGRGAGGNGNGTYSGTGGDSGLVNWGSETNSAGLPGTNFGGGGGGCFRDGGGNVSGGEGAKGIIIITYNVY